MTVFHGDLTPLDIVDIFCQQKAPGSIISGLNKEISRIRQVVSPGVWTGTLERDDEARHFKGEAKALRIVSRHYPHKPLFLVDQGTFLDQQARRADR